MGSACSTGAKKKVGEPVAVSENNGEKGGDAGTTVKGGEAGTTAKNGEKGRDAATTALAPAQGRGDVYAQGILGAACLMAGVPAEDKLHGGMALFIVDPQIDFHEGGSLEVKGANDDSQRIIELIGRCSKVIERIVVTLDTHHAMHIHHKHFWMDKDGNPPQPFTVMSKKDIQDRRWEPRIPEHQKWAEKYVEKLEEGKRFPMIIWPDHCLLGSEGHAVHPPLMEALNKWAGERKRSISWYLKGLNNNVEMYSALGAEVPFEEDFATFPQFGKEGIVQLLATHEKVICCGQALSHCVNNTVRDLETAWPEGSSRKDIVVLQDGSSPVPGFEKAANDFVEYIKGKGVTVCKAGDVQPTMVKAVPPNTAGPEARKKPTNGFRAGAAGLANGVPAEDTLEGGAALFIVDPQQDFHPGGSLPIKGATQDSQRIADFVKQHAEKIERVVVTLDSHHLMHIHHPDFWINAEGKHPSEFAIIEVADVEKGAWKPAQEEMASWAKEYVQKLKEGKRFQLQVWPQHCLLGSKGHTVEKNLWSALNEWAIKRGRSINWLLKGLNNRTEMYSAFKAEVPLDDDPRTKLDMEVIKLLAKHKKVYCCGQALSHCVNHSVRDLVDAWAALPEKRSKLDIVVLEDCSSSVLLPDGSPVRDGPEFLEWARTEGGLTVVKSCDAEVPDAVVP